MAREITLIGLSQQDIERAMAASDLLLMDQHVEDCPVRHGASISCVFPFACCVFDEFKLTNEKETPSTLAPVVPS